MLETPSFFGNDEFETAFRIGNFCVVTENQMNLEVHNSLAGSLSGVHATRRTGVLALDTK